MIEPKPYNIDGARYKDLILEKLLPAIAEKCPLAMKSKPIIVQHDNAPPHCAVSSSLPELVDRSSALGITVCIKEQPPNSPDLNVLDLGVFRALQSCQFQNVPTDLTQLIQQTKQVYNNYPMSKLNDVWLTLQLCMNQIIENDGGNKYKLQHMGKRKLERQGLLPRNIFAVTMHPVFDGNHGGEEEAGSDEDDGILEEVSI